MRIVLFGKNGQLGWELQRILPSYQELDLTNLKMLETKLDELKPKLIVNASAYTAVDRAESERELAMTINGKASGVMAEVARKLGAMLVHYSTDYVFDGTKGTPYIETDATHPINVYGESKLAGEEAIRKAADSYLILRTSWVYSLRLQSGFVKKVMSWARQNEVLRIVEDQVGCPTWARMLAEATGLLLAQRKTHPAEYFKPYSGVYHLAGKGGVSRLDWAKAILALDPNREEQQVKKLDSALSSEFPTPATRPLHSVLSSELFEKTFSLRTPGWEESLALAMAK